MKRSKDPTFILELKLYPEMWQCHVIDKRMDIGRMMYNWLHGKVEKRYKAMTELKEYRHAKWQYRQKDTATRKKGEDTLNELRKKYGINENTFQKDLKVQQHYFKMHISSNVGQKIATRLWKAYDDLIFGSGKSVHWQKFGSFNSLEGKDNKNGISFHGNKLTWNGLEIPVQINLKNAYELMTLEHKVAYCRVVRRVIRSKNRYFLQLVLKGIAPPKYDAQTGDFKHVLGKGDVGFDIGTQTLSVSSATDVKLLELADGLQGMEDKKRRLLRKMDRSRRATNPDNYNPDGTIRKQGNRKVEWVRSNRYMDTLLRLKEVSRKQAAVRKLMHERLANSLLHLGDSFKVENMNFSALMKRAKETKQNNKGKFLSKKRYGKSIANKAPAMFLRILDRKLRNRGTQLFKINTQMAKASQFDHISRLCVKQSLSKRWKTVGGRPVQRDMYSSFLVMNTDAKLEKPNVAKCNATYDNFLRLHDIEVARLATLEKTTGKRNLSSMGV